MTGFIPFVAHTNQVIAYDCGIEISEDDRSRIDVQVAREQSLSQGII